jgi:hypothetical protein
MKWLVALLLAVTVAALWPAPAAAQYCPNGFHLVDEGTDAAVDRNEDDLICVKHVTPTGGRDVHIDDGVPLQRWLRDHNIGGTVP